MAIWSREYTDDRTYFTVEGGMIQRQESQLTIKVFGIRMLRRKMDFKADAIEKKTGLGFNKD